MTKSFSVPATALVVAASSALLPIAATAQSAVKSKTPHPNDIYYSNPPPAPATARIMNATAPAAPAYGQGYRPALVSEPEPVSRLSSYNGLSRGFTQPPAPIWQGAYFGLNGGYTWGHDASGGTLGAHLGYNWQGASNWLLGLEGDLGWSGVDGSVTSGAAAGQFSQDWTSSVRARAGYAWGPVLFYGTAGGAMAGQSATLTAPGGSIGANETRFGIVYGLGVEGKLSQSISGRVEALNYQFSPQTYVVPGATMKVDPSHTVLRAGLSYHFN
jgi:outer membrane immunogenic protein